MAIPLPKRAPERRRKVRAGGVAVAIVLLLPVADGAHAQTRLTPTLRADVTFTNNVKLNPDDERRSDVVFTLAPGLEIDYRAPRVTVRGFVQLPAYLYARTEEENRVIPQADLTAKFEVVPQFFFVDAAVSASQAYYSPFGTTPNSPVNPSDNEYRFTSYRVSPYIEGWIGGNVRYLLRNDNIWVNTFGQGGQIGNDGQYTNRLTGSLVREPAPFGWSAEIDRAEYRFDNRQRDQILALARLTASWQASPALRLFVSGGYEDNEFPLTTSSGAIYGAGLGWRPTDRTRVDLSWEERFFGASYRASFEHRLPLAVVNVGASRNMTSYPETLAALPAGAFVPGLLNQILAGRIPDPAERAQFIANFIASNGLPLFLADPLSIYNQQVYLEERAYATVGLLGVRNTLFLNGWRLKTEPITGAGELLPPLIQTASDSTQFGASATWSYRITQATSSTLTLYWSRTEPNDPARALEEQEQRGARFTLTHPLTPRTSLVGGVGWQERRSDIPRDNFSETSVFAGFSYRGL